MQEHQLKKALRGKLIETVTLVVVLLTAATFSGCASTFQIVREDRPVRFTTVEGEVSSIPLADDVEGPTTVETRPTWCHRNRVGCVLTIVGTVLATGAAAAAIGVAAAPDVTHVGN